MFGLGWAAEPILFFFAGNGDSEVRVWWREGKFMQFEGIGGAARVRRYGGLCGPDVVGRIEVGIIFRGRDPIAGRG